VRGESADLARPRAGSRILARQAAPLSYAVRLAGSREEMRAAQALRFAVFNLELGEGLESSYDTCLDEDPFDAICDHLIVESDGEVVGTYRLQTGRTAAAHLGYYSEGEFDFAPFEARRDEIVELGRACVAREHRNLAVLGLLWRGIFDYARSVGGRYLVGCGSLASQVEAEGAALYHTLVQRFSAPAGWRTQPRPQCACSLEEPSARAPRPPKLLSAYLSLGATICAPPAIDRDFKTIDFLTLLDVEAIPEDARKILAPSL
jgi:putative hemolysin